MPYSDEQRAAILARARVLREQARTERACRRAATERVLGVAEDPVAKWKREADEQTVRVAAADAELRRAEQAQAARAMPAWSEIDRRISDAIAAEREHMLDVITEALKGLFDDELAPIEDIVAGLQVVVDEMRARQDDGGTIVDLAPRAVN